MGCYEHKGNDLGGRDMSKPRIGIFSLTGCGGDQLQILNMEDSLLELLSRFQIVDFQEGSSVHEAGPIDISFIEGSVSTETDLERLKAIRERTSVLIAIGNCAIDGCIQAMTTNEEELKTNLKEVLVYPSSYTKATVATAAMFRLRSQEKAPQPLLCQLAITAFTFGQLKVAAIINLWT